MSGRGISHRCDGRAAVRGPAVGLVAGLALAQFTALMDRSLLAVLVTPVKASLALSDTQLGLLQGTGFALLYALAIVPAGLLADRVHRRGLLLCGLAVWTAGVLGYASAPGFRWFFLSSLLVGLGQAVLLPAALSLIAERVAPARRARATSVFTAAGLTGRAAALIGGGWLLGALSGRVDLPAEPWRLVVLASLALNLAAVLALATLRDGGAHGERPPPRAGSLRQALRWMAGGAATYVLLLALLSATVLAIQGVAAWTPTLLHRRFALDPAAAALGAGMVTVLAGVAGHGVGGWATDAAMRVQGVRGAFGVAAAALALASPALLLFAHGAGLAASLAGLTLFAFAMGAATPTGLTLLQSVTRTPAKGTVSGLVLAATTLTGLGLGPLLIGLASDRGGVDGNTLGAAAVRVVLPVLLIGITAAAIGAARGESRRPSGSGPR